MDSSAYSFSRPFDIVLCRNIAIYFSEADKLSLFKNIKSAMDKDSCLIIGSTENITGLGLAFDAKRHLGSIFYKFSAEIPTGMPQVRV